MTTEAKSFGPRDQEKQEIKQHVIRMIDVSVEAPGGRELIKNINLNIRPGDKIAIMGEEGNGKSTLAKIIAGVELPAGFHMSGQVERGQEKIAYLPQALPERWLVCSVSDFFLKEEPGEEIDYDRYNEITKIQRALTEVGLDPKMIEGESNINQLSGGEIVRLQIAKLLAKDPEFLVLDEPTNNLDLDTIEWLEDFINNSRAGIVFISHDEYLLANAANRIVHLEQQKRKTAAKSTVANVGYRTYIENRAGAIEKQGNQAAMERRQQKESLKIVRQIKEQVRSQSEAIKDSTVRRLMAKRAKVAKKREQYLEEKELTETPDVEEEIKFEFPEGSTMPQGKTVVELKLDNLTAGEGENKKILCNEEIVYSKSGPGVDIIIGKNGSGKTTLIREILKSMEERGLKPAYFPQDYNEILTNPEKRAVDYLTDEKIGETEARTMMGRMKFTPDEMLQKVSELSGGQRAKLILLMLTFSGRNILVLDEPTRNLSPLSAPVLREALREYPGAVIAVTHDRAFIEELGERIFELDENGLNQVDIE